MQVVLSIAIRYSEDNRIRGGMVLTKALIVIDYTCDFVADDGRLTCGLPGQQVERYITSLTQNFVDQGEYVVFAVDVHEQDDPFHPETKLFPPHNIRGTAGRELYGTLGQYYAQLDPSAHGNRVEWLDKTRYSAFAGTRLDIFLRDHHIQELHLVGVCTDICVLHTAVDAYNLGYDLVIHGQGVASFNQAGHDWALDHFKNTLGAEVR
jgi:nicotinamidase-related amidase